MTSSNEPTILCVASFFKGNEFIRECKLKGASVVLLTRQKLLAAEWAHESLDDLITIPGNNVETYIAAASHVARNRRVSRVVALEEYDVVTAARIREHLCVPGMGTTTARRFQDKLDMRARAREVGIPQPESVPLLNYETIDEFMKHTSAPWMLKPRSGASSMGIRRVCECESVWRAIDELDARETPHDTSDFHLLEQYISGDVYHVDSLVNQGQVIFASVERYGAPPFDISQFGGVTVSHTVKRGSQEEQLLLVLNKRLVGGFGLERGVTHAEFIRRADAEVPRGFAPESGREGNKSRAEDDCAHVSTSDQFYFLEVAARIGGAYTTNTIEAATCINPWREWARIELATRERPYTLPPVRVDYAGIVISLARQEHPSTSGYIDPEIVYRVCKPWHVGLIISSPDYDRVIDLLTQYTHRFRQEFTAVAPPEETSGQYL